MADDSKDAAQLSDFLDVLATFAPTLPEELVEFHLHQAGFNTSDPRIIRLVALVAHKFLLDVTHDTLQYQRIRTASSATASTAGAGATSAAAALMHAAGGATGTGNRVVLTMEDLAASLREYGVNLCKPEYVSDVAHEQ